MTSPDMSSSASEANSQNFCDERQAQGFVLALMGFYSDHGKIDPKIYNAGLRRLFMAHAPAAVRAVIDPVKGLPSRSKWLPTIAEVAEALNGSRDEKPSERFERLARAQIAERMALTYDRKTPEERGAFVRSLGADPDRRRQAVPERIYEQISSEQAAERAEALRLGNGDLAAGYLKMMEST